MDQTCKDCVNFIGMGDWDLCCREEHEGYPFGFLCYEDTLACEKFKPKCTCYHTQYKILGWIGPDEPLKKIVGVCYGTKEREECSCGGDPSMCTFYPKKRQLKFGKWIKVTDMLPIEEDADEDCAILAIHKKSKKKYYHWRSVADNPMDFTHWMPMPELPKED